jgi:hypothetical protein
MKMASPSQPVDNVSTQSGAPSTTGGLAVFLLVMTTATWITVALEVAGKQPVWTSSVLLGLTLVAIFGANAVRPGGKRWNRTVNPRLVLVHCLSYVITSGAAITIVMTQGEAGVALAMGIGVVQFVYGVVLIVRNALA